MPRKDRSQDDGEEVETTEEAMPEVSASVKAEPQHPGLIKVKFGDDTLHVHPTALEEHKKLGWKLA